MVGMDKPRDTTKLYPSDIGMMLLVVGLLQSYWGPTLTFHSVLSVPILALGFVLLVSGVMTTIYGVRKLLPRRGAIMLRELKNEVPRYNGAVIQRLTFQPSRPGARIP